MARLISYPTISTLALGDLFPVTDVSNVGKPLKNVTGTDLLGFIEANAGLWEKTATGINYPGGTVGIGATVPIASSMITVANTRTEPSTSVNSFYNLTYANTANSTASIYGTINRYINSSSFSSKDLVSINNIARTTGTGAITNIYAAYNEADIEGSGNVNLAVGASNISKLDNAGGTVGTISGTNSLVQLLQGEAATVKILNVEFDQSAGTSISGDLSYLYIANQTVGDITGTARAINSQSSLPSYFAGNVGIGATSPTEKLQVTGNVSAARFLGELSGSISTLTTAITKPAATNDTTVATTAFVQNLIGTIPTGLVFQGTWNAATNTPTLASGTGTTGHFYIVSVDGSTNLDGITDWKVGDWAVFVEQGATDAWEKVDNSSVLDGAGTGDQISKWAGSGTSNTLTDSIITDNGTNVGIGTTSPTSLLEISKQLSAASTIDYPYTISSRDDGNSINQAGGEGVGIKFRIAGNAGTTPGDSLVGASIAAIRESSTDTNSSTGLGFFVTQNDETLNEAVRIDQNRNVGIGTPNPQDKLDISAGNIRLDDGRSIRWSTDDANIGRVRIAGNEANDFLQFVTDNSERMRLTNTGLGIGTTSPSAKLHIQNGSSGQTYTNLSGALIDVNGTSNSYSALRVGSSTGNNHLVVTNAGNVGIGTTSPSTKLEVASGHIRLTNAYSLQWASANNRIYNQSSNTVFVNNASESMRILSNGNVGIGTTSPQELLHLSSTTGGTMFVLEGNNPEILLDDNNGDNVYIRNTGGDLAFKRTDGSSVNMTIKQDGNVGIGTTSPAQKLHVSGNIRVGSSSASIYSNKFVALSSGNLELRTFNGGDVIINATTGDNVGIGTIDPNAPLSVHNTTSTLGSRVASFYHNNGSNNPFIEINSLSDGMQLKAGFTTGVAGHLDILTGGGSSFITLSTNNNEAVRVTAAGRVGIGTTSPTRKLDVEHDGWDGVEIRTASANGSGINLINSQRNFALYSRSNAFHIRDITDSDTPRFVIRSTGNVGIGTDSPTSKLDVAGGDIELNDVAAGIIMRSPDGTKYRITVANGGALTVTAV